MNVEQTEIPGTETTETIEEAPATDKLSDSETLRELALSVISHAMGATVDFLEENFGKNHPMSFLIVGLIDSPNGPIKPHADSDFPACIALSGQHETFIKLAPQLADRITQLQDQRLAMELKRDQAIEEFSSMMNLVLRKGTEKKAEEESVQ